LCIDASSRTPAFVCHIFPCRADNANVGAAPRLHLLDQPR
jgi:hypothetical protein